MRKLRTKDGRPTNRQYDQTQLKLSQFQYQPHKDYLGHVFRWGFATRFVNRDVRILDVGCGQEMPFARSLGGSNPNSVPRLYVGCDLNKIRTPVSRKNFHIYDECNFIKSWRKISKSHGPFDLIVNFEVFEHMTMEDGRKMLRAFRRCLSEKGFLIFSTPVYSDRYKMARNHINELTKSEMEDELHGAGFKIVNQFGTFCNLPDIKKVASKEQLKALSGAADFYGNEILGCYLSPMYPEASRNITHVCVLKTNKSVSGFKLKKSIVR